MPGGRKFPGEFRIWGLPTLLGLVMFLQKLYVKFQPPGPQNVTVFEDKVFKEGTKLG